jgi:hypothetical protein
MLEAFRGRRVRSGYIYFIDAEEDRLARLLTSTN